MGLTKNSPVLGDYLDNTPHAHGFLNYEISGSWTAETVGGRYFIVEDADSGGAFAEVLQGSLFGNASGVSLPYPTEPFFDYIYDSTTGVLKKILRVINNNRIEVSSEFTGLSAATMAVTTSKVKCPRKAIFSPADSSNLVDLYLCDGAQQSITASSPIIFDNNDSTLTPFVTKTDGIVGASYIY